MGAPTFNVGAPTWPPHPPTFGAPRGTRGAPLLRVRFIPLFSFFAGFVGVTPAGSFLVGTIAEHLGPRAAFIASGGLGLVSVIIVAAWWKLRRRERPD